MHPSFRSLLAGVGALLLLLHHRCCCPCYLLSAPRTCCCTPAEQRILTVALLNLPPPPAPSPARSTEPPTLRARWPRPTAWCAVDCSVWFGSPSCGAMRRVGICSERGAQISESGACACAAAGAWTGLEVTLRRTLGLLTAGLFNPCTAGEPLRSWEHLHAAHYSRHLRLSCSVSHPVRVSHCVCR